MKVLSQGSAVGSLNLEGRAPGIDSGEPMGAGGSAAVTRARGRVLVVDDDDDVRTCLAEIIKFDGWEVSQARNGQEALVKAREERPHVLLLDHQMPGLTGDEVYRQLRDEGLDLPAVMITAARAVIGAPEGILFCVSKPFDYLELLETLARAYASRRAELH